MTRQAGLKIVNQFQRGLITENTGLNFPEDAVTDSLNVIFEPESIARRRKGFDFESSAAFATPLSAPTQDAFVEYLWKAAAGNAENNFVVQQVGRYITFFRTSETSLSNGIISDGIDLNTHKVSGAPSVYNVPCSFSSGANYLFVTHPYCEPFYVEYTGTSGNEFTSHEITIQIRDFEGIDDNYDIDERRTTITSAHRYNLKNQGWFEDVLINSAGDQAEPINYFYTALGGTSLGNRYPSNADIWWLFKRINSDGVEIFDPDDTVGINIVGNTQAPKGHFILDAFNQDRSDVSGVSSLSSVTSNNRRPSTVAFFAGRVWYAGVNHKKFSSTIYFSQIAERDDQFGFCYQQNDPTSQSTPDLLPSDGGTVKIPDMGTVIKMIPIQSSMLIFATNGVWAIAGSEGIGFRATDYSVIKVSAVNATNSLSFVDVEGFAMWWNADGIYGITTNQIGSFQVESVSDTSIKTFYDNIPTDSKRYAKAAYNSRDKVIQWVYRSTDPTVNQRYQYDRILNYNLLSKAFYAFSISSGATVRGIVSIEGIGTIAEEETVVDSSSAVVENSALDDVVVTVLTTQNLSSVFKYTTFNADGDWSFAEEYDTDYVDWASSGSPVDFETYFITGYSISFPAGRGSAGMASMYQQANYVLVYCNEVEGSSVWVQGIFDYTTSGNTGKWGTRQQGYNSALSNRSVRIKKLKVRGKGKAIQLKFTASDGNPFEVIGWSMVQTANSVV